MKNSKLNSILLFACFAISATNIYAGGFTWSGGDGTTAPLWRIYFRSIVLPVDKPEDGDQIAIIDLGNGNRVVGIYVVNASDLLNSKAKSLAFSTLQKGSGYSRGNLYSFQYWDASAKKTYTECTVEIIKFGGYNETTFPDEDGKQSAFNLTFLQ